MHETYDSTITLVRLRLPLGWCVNSHAAILPDFAGLSVRTLATRATFDSGLSGSYKTRRRNRPGLAASPGGPFFDEDSATPEDCSNSFYPLRLPRISEAERSVFTIRHLRQLAHRVFPAEALDETSRCFT